MALQVMFPPISVLTVTRRSMTTERCLSSVAKQDYPGEVRHIILIDGDSDVLVAWQEACKSLENTVKFMPRSPQDQNGPKRLAYLRNAAVELATSEYVVFLDDDNAWSPDHLSSLWSTLVAGEYYMTHSYRLMYEFDGTPYVQPEFPWKRDKAERERIYKLHAELGIVTLGSNIVRDFVGIPESCVDLGEWLLKREFLIANPFVSTYSEEDWWDIKVEDGKLADSIEQSNLPIGCSELPTLHYYLGGYSNNFSEKATIYWPPPEIVGVNGESTEDR